MLKIKDNTSKQKLSYINATFWNNQKIKETLINMKSIRNGTIYINDIVVNEYNKNTNQVLPKSNASFIKQVKKLNKENYFDDLVDKVENNPISAMIGINTYDFMNAVDRLNKIPDHNDLLKENQELKKQLEDISEELELVRCDLHNRTSERDSYERELNECLSQQKEFIEYLEDMLDGENDIFSVVRVKDVLQKYREIIGGNDV